MRNTILIILLALTVLLGGCAEISAFRTAVASHGEDGSDQTLETAVWAMCKGSPVGAVKRRFKTDQEREAYNVLCPDGELP